MILNSLQRSDENGELVLIDGAFCRWHLRRDRQLTIGEIYVLKSKRKKGIARSILEELKKVDGAKFILAKCPVDYESNSWYEKMGFVLDRKEQSRSGKELNVWVYNLLP